ncbi:MAG TPA: methyltransferase domain-containing protein [bacterium]|jgi:ubiquinone/menaquinone biosynthesis C-methylase UbiE
MVTGYVADLAYVLTAIWESFPPRSAIRWWAQRRYRKLAPQYGRTIAGHAVYGAALDAALRRLGPAPRRILDVGTGTGFAASRAKEIFPSAIVVGCDLSSDMLQQAQTRGSPAALIRCDSSQLPFRSGAFDLAIVHNAPPPVREVARVVGAGGAVVLGFSSGAGLPAWAVARLSDKLREAGCAAVVWDHAGDGLYVLARKTMEAAA